MAVRSTDNGSLLFATGLDNSGLLRGKLDAENIIVSLGKRISKINPFLGLSVAAVAAFGKISSDAYKMARSFEQAMKEVETISNATQDNFKGISKEVFELTKITPDSPVKLANAYYQIVSAGYDGAKGLKLLETASKAAVGGVTDTKTAADGLTTVLNAFGIEADNAGKVADVMFKTVQLGKTTFSELASSMATVAPIAAASNIEFEQVSGAIATLTKQGVPTAQAMTQIRSAIIGANEALGDGWAQTMTLQEAFQLLYDKAGGSQTELQGMVGRVEAVSAVLGIAGKNAKGAASDLDAMNNSVGASEDAFNRMASSNVNQWAILGNRIKATTKDIGDSILQMSSGVAKLMNDALEETKTLKNEVSKQASEYQILKNTVLDVNTEFSKKLEILRKLKNEYPEYLGNIDLDKVKNDNLDDVLKKVKGTLEDINKLHERRLELSGFEDSANSARKQQQIYKGLYQKNLSDFFIVAKKASDFAKQNNIELNYSLSDDPQKIYEEIERAFITDDNDGLLSQLFGDSNSIVTELFNINESIGIYKDRLSDATNELNNENDALQKQRVLIRDNEAGYKDVVNEISKINSISGLDNYDKNYKFPKIKEAIKDRLDILTTIEEIKGIDKTDLKNNPNALSKYLQDENKEIAEAAKNRFDLLNKQYTSKGGDEDNTYQGLLNKKRKQYELYESYVTLLGKEEAEKRFNNLLTEGENYSDYLKSELEKFKDFQDKKDAIVEAASSSDTIINPREKATNLPPLKTASINLDFKIDTKSYEAVNREIKRLEDKARRSQDANEQEALGEKIKVEKKKLEAIEKRIYGAEKAEEDFYKTIQSLSRKGLQKEKEKLKESQKSIEKYTDEAAKEYEELQDKIRKINEEISEDTAGLAEEFSSAFSGLSDLFSKFGDEDTSKLFDQLSGVASGVSKIASGDIIGGAIQTLTSAISVEVVSDTSKFEAAIKGLEKAIDRLDYVISKSIGGDKIDNRKSAISDLEELEKQADLAYRAEEEARKQVKFLGINIYKKGSGSGTDPAKLDELEQKAEEARRRVEDLKSELNELYTGTTQQSIVDTIISGLKSGKKDIQDFANDIKNILQDALLQSFQIKYLDKEIDEFYKRFAEAGSDQKYTSNELKGLTNFLDSVLTGAKSEIEAINNVLDQAGIGSLGSDNSQQGLSGAISTITEDTANVLSGTLNSIMIDVARGIAVAEKNSTYLAGIENNTSFNRYLETIDQKLGDIESKL